MARNAEGREMRYGATFHTSRKPKRREIPYGAKSHTARNPEERRRRGLTAIVRQGLRLGNPGVRLAPPYALRIAPRHALWDFAPYGISRRSAFRAVRLSPSNPSP